MGGKGKVDGLLPGVALGPIKGQLGFVPQQMLGVVTLVGKVFRLCHVHIQILEKRREEKRGKGFLSFF